MRPSEGSREPNTFIAECVHLGRDSARFPNVSSFRQLYDFGRCEGCRVIAGWRPENRRSHFTQWQVLRREDQGIESRVQGLRLLRERIAKVSWDTFIIIISYSRFFGIESTEIKIQ